MYDLLIRDGLVVDGSGLPGRIGDVAITDGRIVATGRLRGERATRVIDADGMVVAPGIVDAHTHYDPQITWDPLCDTSSLHGVTTVAAGNCGFSIAPVARGRPRRTRRRCSPASRGWTPPRSTRSRGASRPSPSSSPPAPAGSGVNLGMYIGHSAVRRWVIGEAAYERASTDDELQQIAAIVDQAMRDGALGWSSSHAPTHLDMADRPVPSRLSVDRRAAHAGRGRRPLRPGLDRLCPGERRGGHLAPPTATC